MMMSRRRRLIRELRLPCEWLRTIERDPIANVQVIPGFILCSFSSHTENPGREGEDEERAVALIKEVYLIDSERWNVHFQQLSKINGAIINRDTIFRWGSK